MWCVCNSGKKCEELRSTCNGRSQECQGRGPGWPDDFESNRIIGKKQFLMGQDLHSKAGKEIKGPINSIHTYLDITQVHVEESAYGPSGRTCRPAMGYSFAAGTTDGALICSKSTATG